MGWYYCHIRTLEDGFGETDTSMTAPSTLIAAEQLLREHGRRLSKDASLIMTVATRSKGTIRPIVGPEDRRAEACEPDRQPEPELAMERAVDLLRRAFLPCRTGCGDCYTCEVQDFLKSYDKAHAATEQEATTGSERIPGENPEPGRPLPDPPKAPPEPTPPLGGETLDRATAVGLLQAGQIDHLKALDAWASGRLLETQWKRWMDAKLKALTSIVTDKGTLAELIEELTKLKNAWS